MKRLLINDRSSYAVPTKRQYTDEGFLKVPGRVARTGIQQYLASELGLTDRNPNEIINVFRPVDEVFRPESLDTYLGADVTNDHPKELVNADTYKGVTVGTVVSVGRQDGDFIEADLIIKDSQAIKKIESGKVQLSAGYTSLYDEEKGTTPDGVEYEFIQRDIKINHVALVDRARAGFQARLHDNNPKGLNPMIKVNLDSGRSVEIEDAATATLVNDTIERLTKRITDAETEKEEAKDEAEKAKAEKDMAEEKAKKAEEKSSDDALNARIAAIASTTDSARKIAGDEFTCESIDTTEIKRAALTKCNDTLDFSEKSQAYIDAAFDMAVLSGKPANTQTPAQVAQLAKDGANAQPTADAKPSARQAHLDSMQGAWKKTTGEV